MKLIHDKTMQKIVYSIWSHDFEKKVKKSNWDVDIINFSMAVPNFKKLFLFYEMTDVDVYYVHDSKQIYWFFTGYRKDIINCLKEIYKEIYKQEYKNE